MKVILITGSIPAFHIHSCTCRNPTYTTRIIRKKSDSKEQASTPCWLHEKKTHIVDSNYQGKRLNVQNYTMQQLYKQQNEENVNKDTKVTKEEIQMRKKRHEASFSWVFWVFSHNVDQSCEICLFARGECEWSECVLGEGG